MTLSSKLSRRRWLQTAGVASAALPFPRLFSAPKARAQEGSEPRFMLLMTSAHGMQPHAFRMNVPGLIDGQDSSASLSRAALSPILQPLQQHAGKLNVIEGLAKTSSLLGGTTAHASSAHTLCHYPTSRRTGSPKGGGPSLDVIVGRALGRPDRYRFLVWGVGGGANASWSARDIANAPVRSPVEAWKQLFDVDVANATPLHYVAQRYQALAGRLSGEDRARIDQHQQLVAETGARIRGIAGASCEETMATPPNSYPNKLEMVEQYARLAAIAFSCDLTRVIVFSVGQLTASEFGAPPLDVHQEVAHGSGASDPNDPTQPRDPRRAQRMSDYCRRHAEYLNAFLNELDSVPMLGGSLLDHTLVCWSPHMATGDHNIVEGYHVLAGGGAIGMTTGRYLRYAASRPNPRPDLYGAKSDRIGPAHTQLHYTLCEKLGVRQDSLGTPDARSGEGEAIVLNAPLPLL